MEEESTQQEETAGASLTQTEAPLMLQNIALISTDTSISITEADGTLMDTDVPLHQDNTCTPLAQSAVSMHQTDLSLTHVNVSMPQVGSSLTRVDVTMPQAHSSLIQVGVSLPPADSSLTHAEVSLPQADSSLPSLPHVDVSLSQATEPLTQVDVSLSQTTEALTQVIVPLPQADASLTQTDTSMNEADVPLTQTDASLTQTVTQKVGQTSQSDGVEGGGSNTGDDKLNEEDKEDDDEEQDADSILLPVNPVVLPVPQVPSLTCNICRQQFGRQSHLTRHIEACHGERGTHQCTRCSATFNRKDSLNRHMTTQHVENPRRFKCTVDGCDKDFNRKDHLNKHLRGVHKVEPLPSTPIKSGAVGGSEDEDCDDDEEEMEFVIAEGDRGSNLTDALAEVSSTLPSDKKRHKCSNQGCSAEYSSSEHLQRHLSRGHTQEVQLPVWGHSIFGMSDVKMDMMDEGDSVLCMFCCSTYPQQPLDIEKQRKSMLANDPHFTKFCEAALRQQRKRMTANSILKSLNSLNKLSVCQSCFNKIGYAMGTKVVADEVDARVQDLRRQLDGELKKLQSEVDQFYEEMKLIEDVIRCSDLSSLESYLSGIEAPEEKEQSSVVLLLRDGIFAVMNDVNIYCQRMRGQQVVVNTAPLPRRSTSVAPPASKDKHRPKGKKKRKLKHKSKNSINPLLHVKVEHAAGGEDSENPVTDMDDGKASGEDGAVMVTKEKAFDTETPRRQPVREARVRTEEFLKTLFEKQNASLDDDLDAVVKTEVPSDTEAEPPGNEDAVPVSDDINMSSEQNTEGDKEDPQGGGEEEVKGKKVVAALAAKAGKTEASKKEGQQDENVVGENNEKDKEATQNAEAVEPPPFEEILIDDDDFEDLFSDHETSDEDFNFDAEHDDDDSKSESSESESEDESENESDDEPVSKRARRSAGSGQGRRGRKPGSHYDPFNFKRSKSSYKSPLKTKSTAKLAQQHNIDMSGMSEFKKRLLCRILKKNVKSPGLAVPDPDQDPLSTTSVEADPRSNFRFEYNSQQGTLMLGDVHVLIHEDSSSLQCSKCGYLASPAEKPRRSVPRIMYNHILGKHLFAFQCPQCSATLGSYRRYLDHIKGHQMGFMCDVCGKPLFSEEALRRHRWGHQNAEEMADAVAKGQKDPRRKHDPTLTFQCTTCGKVFSKKMLLRQHEKTHAENRERIVCTLCGKTFLPSGFISHQKYSCFPEGYEPPRVQCQLCPSTFKSVVLRARHMKYAHSQASIEKPYKCHMCGKGFAANEHLQKHIKRHSDARPYLCRKGCGANYKTRKDCTRHEKKCEGNGTPMMRHKGRNDQLNAAVSVPKQEPGLQTEVPTTAPILHSQPTPVIIQTHQVQQPQHPPPQQQFNVYNIL